MIKQSKAIAYKSFKQKVWHMRHRQLVTNGTVIIILRAAVCKISRICRQNGNFEILHIQSEKTLWWNFFENHNQSFQRIFFFEKTGKKWIAAPRHIVAGLKPLNYTIFKALGKKDGSRKQVHLWQVSKASQLQYYLVKILQDNEFFTRLKNARRLLSSALP